MSDLQTIYREDAEKEVEYMEAGLKTIAAFYNQVKAQNAPLPLLERLNDIWATLHTAKVMLFNILPCFPSEDPKRQ